MALQKTITLPNSVVTTYYKIIKHSIDAVSKIAEVTVGGYLDKAARESNVGSPATTLFFPEIQLTDILTNPFPEMYSLLPAAKTHALQETPPLEGATEDQ